MGIRPFILFDGVCNLCDSSVNFILRHDKKNRLLFAPLQSTAGRELASQFGFSPDYMGSLIFVENGKAYTRSSAALRIAAYLNGAWPLLKVLLVVPVFIRDSVYDWIGRNRYRWFGKKESCTIPTPALRARFIATSA